MIRTNSQAANQRLVRAFDSLLPYSWLLPVIASLFLARNDFSLVGTVLHGDVQLSDGAGWLGCSFSFPFGEEWKSDWCLRRPVATLILSVHAKMLFLGTFAPLLLNTAIPALSVTFLLMTVRQMGASPVAVFFTALIPLYMVMVSGTYFGPEAYAIGLSAFSLAMLGRLWLGETGYLLYLGPAAAGLAYLARPGNPFLLGFLVLIFLLFAAGARDRSKAVSIVSISAIAPFGFAPVLRLFPGLENAGHSANSASTVYSLLSPRARSWGDVYEIFSTEENLAGLSVDSFEWRDYVIRAAFAEFFDAPGVALSQVARNLARFFDQGILNLFLNVPGPNFSGLKLTNWFENLHALDDFAFQQVGLGLWISSALILFVAGLALSRTVRSCFPRNRGDFTAAAARIVRESPVLVPGVAFAGSFLFFGLVGHDEAYRHLSMTIPVLTFLPFAWMPIRQARRSSVDG